MGYTKPEPWGAGDRVSMSILQVHPAPQCTNVCDLQLLAILQDPEAELEPASLPTAYCAMNCRGEAVLGECSEGIDDCCLAATRSLSSSCGVGDFLPAMVSAPVPAMAPAAAALVARPGD